MRNFHICGCCIQATEALNNQMMVPGTATIVNALASKFQLEFR